MKRYFLQVVALSAFAFTLFCSSCKKDSNEKLPAVPVPIDVTADQRSLISSENSFAFDIFRNITGDTPESQNIIISPLSISTALSMTLNGANGDTRKAMIEALRMNGLTPEMINNAYKDLTAALLSVDKRVIINLANSVWTEKNFVSKKPFADILTEFYSAEAKEFDITDPQTPEMINSWIEGKTNGLINNMVDNLDPSTVMLLIDAIYFKGKWSSQFDKSNTIDAPFTLNEGNSSQVPMMKQTFTYKYFKGDSFTFAELPYGQGNFVMDVILPDNINGVSSVTTLLTGENYSTWLAQLSEQEIKVSFPRFKYGFRKELREILSNMGMGVAFGDGADFSNISDLDLFINLVLHQAFIESNEEGTEAAAATIVGVGVTSVHEPPALNLNHPFIYIIRETTTNSILFMGRVSDPLAN